MVRRSLALAPLVRLGLLSACTHADDGASSAEAAQIERYSPYPFVQGRTQHRVSGVAWQQDGPTYCPSTVDVPHGGAWLRSADRIEEMKPVLRAQVVPATCDE